MKVLSFRYNVNFVLALICIIDKVVPALVENTAENLDISVKRFRVVAVRGVKGRANASKKFSPIVYEKAFRGGWLEDVSVEISTELNMVQLNQPTNANGFNLIAYTENFSKLTMLPDKQDPAMYILKLQEIHTPTQQKHIFQMVDDLILHRVENSFYACPLDYIIHRQEYINAVNQGTQPDFKFRVITWMNRAHAAQSNHENYCERTILVRCSVEVGDICEMRKFETGFEKNSTIVPLGTRATRDMISQNPFIPKLNENEIVGLIYNTSISL